jgi:hypothetical protein
VRVDRQPVGPPPTRLTKISGVPGFSGDPLTGILTRMSVAVLAMKNAVFLLWNARLLAPIPAAWSA